ncbi:MAG: hypothetical protein B7Y12_08360 [Rhizobiales bacterium 24-66-13]|nr:MAG: hypothetical protein B7Y61_04820 [Rhizobiales bacterium 35-66-30]OYZ79844.1 MAG: hypothetical protein B7Y12_08360 [Rhizobiales bacterium 24-66-13]OZB07463.1 MAG: hypothetical protein B7X67_08740 [Rhizobiales bacterium 39-66-18]
MLLGSRVGRLQEQEEGTPLLEGPRLLGRLKLHYVAMTRPSHLLCVAMRKDAFVLEELAVLQAMGWAIIDCCTAYAGSTPDLPNVAGGSATDKQRLRPQEETR